MNWFLQKLKSLLINNWFNNNELKQINESFNNSVYSYWDFFIKINTKPDWLFLEYEYNILKSIENRFAPKSLFYWDFIHDDIRYYILVLQKLDWRNIDYEWNNLSNNEKGSLIKDIVTIVKQINSYKHEDFDFERKKYDLAQNIEYNYKLMQTNPLLDKFKTDNLYKDFMNLKEHINNSNCYLIHNDLWYKNILANDWKLSGIIDFEISIFAPKEFELFKILHHRISAQNYIENWWVDYTEIEFMEMLLKEISVNYEEIYQYSNIVEEFYLYNVNTYFQRLTRYNEDWYRQGEVENFCDKICDLDRCRDLLNSLK